MSEYLARLHAEHKARRGVYFTPTESPNSIKLKRILFIDRDVLNINSIIKICCDYFGHGVKLIKGPRRSKSFVHTRHMIFYIGNEIFGISSVKIAKVCGQKWHTTVLAGRNNIKHQLTYDRNCAKQLRDIRMRVGR